LVCTHPTHTLAPRRAARTVERLLDRCWRTPHVASLRSRFAPISRRRPRPPRDTPAHLASTPLASARHPRASRIDHRGLRAIPPPISRRHPRSTRDGRRRPTRSPRRLHTRGAASNVRTSHVRSADLEGVFARCEVPLRTRRGWRARRDDAA
jgi:hypothetical protein